jgi:hypothetical protein
LRARLADARKTSALFDTPTLTRNIESLYLRLATRHAQGLGPDHLAAESSVTVKT